jgi:6-phosphogluconolactonase (cycloisomerase 2 family)
VAVSGDGKSVYTVGGGDDAIVRFNRNTTTGALTFAECFDDEDETGEEDCANAPGLENAQGVAVSGDGKSVYVAGAGDGTVVRFNRTTTGNISFSECFDDEDGVGDEACTNAPGLAGTNSVTVSGDGKSVYAAADNDDTIVRFNRTTTGNISFSECFDDRGSNSELAKCTTRPGLAGARGVAVSGDGKSLYSGGPGDDAIVRFNRNTTTGNISFSQCLDDEDTNLEGADCTNAPGLAGARSAAVSGDGKSLYAVGGNDDAIVRFNRNTTTGALTFGACIEDEDSNFEGGKCGNAPGLGGIGSVAVSGDGRSLYAASEAIVGFSRNTTTGNISFSECFDDEDEVGEEDCTTAPGLAGIDSVAVSRDGKSLYSTSNSDDAIVRFNREPLPPPAPPPPPPGGDDALPSNEFEFGKVKKNKKKGTAKLTVLVPGPGELDLAKTKKIKGDEEGVEAAAASTTQPDTKAKLKIKPRRKAKKKLNRRGKAKVKAEVTYTPTGGDPNIKSRKVKLKKKR